MSTALAIDISGIAHQTWHTIEPSSPSLEKATFRTQFFREIYQAVIEASPDRVIFVMDAREGYWRHDIYRQYYLDKIDIAKDESGMLWMSHDQNIYAIEQTGAGIFTKQKKKNGEAPENLMWVNLKEADLTEFQDVMTQIRDNYPKYKGGRNKAKWAQVTSKSEWIEEVNNLTREIALALGAAVIQVPKAEADDIMHTLAKSKGDKHSLVIMSEDSDMDQLQSYPNVIRYKPSCKEFVQVEDPLYGIRMKVILGDAGDNVKSVKRWVSRKPTKKDPRTGMIKPIGVTGAEELLASGKLRATAIAEGWIDNLEFNTKMIYLPASPVELQATILDVAQEAVTNVPKSGRIDSFGIPLSELKIMRATATIRKVQFSATGTAEEG